MIFFSSASQSEAIVTAAATVHRRISNCTATSDYYDDMQQLVSCIDPVDALPRLTRGVLAVQWGNGLRATLTTAIFENVAIPPPATEAMDGESMKVSIVALPRV